MRMKFDPAAIAANPRLAVIQEGPDLLRFVIAGQSATVMVRLDPADLSMDLVPQQDVGHRQLVAELGLA